MLHIGFCCYFSTDALIRNFPLKSQSVELCLSWLSFVRVLVEKHWKFFQKSRINKMFFACPEKWEGISLRNQRNIKFSLRVGSSRCPSRNSSRNTVRLQVESVCSCLHVFNARFVFDISWFCIGTVSRNAIVLWWSSILRVCSVVKLIHCWMCFWHFFCKVGHVLCQDHFRGSPMCFCVAGCCFGIFRSGVWFFSC